MRRPLAAAVRCAAAVLAVGCQPLTGERLGSGTYEMAAEGAVTDRYAGAADYHRTAALAGPDGYGVWLDLPGRSPTSPAGLGLSSARRLRPGTYDVASFRQYPESPPRGTVSAHFSATSGCPCYASDSGVVRITLPPGGAEDGLAGEFRVYLSTREPGAASSRRDTVLRVALTGTFRLR